MRVSIRQGRVMCDEDKVSRMTFANRDFIIDSCYFYAFDIGGLSNLLGQRFQGQYK